ncbi:hypothetical protein DBV15_01533 [Temnothorax longispinosus]|uniref:Endonuclease/exonuclease/phosphatase domain-containing protein n=1 Tax=Temnothorax longispinosus TaxID=300112 RepID=A0A4S2KTC1_9HYME|nr:hypothetical protein DBV15_01533 [Temnothorax longispinosus]
MVFFEILCCIAAVIFPLYYFFTSTFDFWKSRGVPGPRPIPGFGTSKNVVLGKVSFSGYMKKLYNDYKDEPLVGIFAGRRPILIVKHPDLIKNILIKDFSIFPDRRYRPRDKYCDINASGILAYDPSLLSPRLATRSREQTRAIPTKLSPEACSESSKQHNWRRRRNAEGRKLLEFIEEEGLGILNTDGEFTFTGGRGESVIDYVIGNQEIWEKAEEINIGEAIYSDHQPITIRVKGTIERGKKEKRVRKIMNWSKKGKESYKKRIGEDRRYEHKGNNGRNEEGGRAGRRMERNKRRPESKE